MNKLIPLMAIGTIFGALKFLDVYNNRVKENNLSVDDLDKDLKDIQTELGRLIDLKVVNDRFEATGMLHPITLSVDGIEISVKIQELTDRIDVIIGIRKDLKSKINKESK